MAPRWSSGKPYQKARSLYGVRRPASQDWQDNLSLWFHYSLSRFEGETAVRPSAHVPVRIRSWIIEIARKDPRAGTIIPITTGQGQT